MTDTDTSSTDTCTVCGAPATHYTITVPTYADDNSNEITGAAYEPRCLEHALTWHIP